MKITNSFLNKVESKILFTKGIGAYPLNYFNVGKFGFSEFSASEYMFDYKTDEQKLVEFLKLLKENA